MTAVIVRGRYVDQLGDPASGHVNFAARPAVVYDTTTNDFIIGQSRTVTLDGNGAFEVALQATDDPDLQPTAWTYQVREWIGDAWLRPPFDITVPVAAAAAGIDLGSVVPATASFGT